MDIIGPLRKTERGNRYILNVVDHFTTHVEAYALQDQEATTVARAFLNQFVACYGVACVNHTDQGTNFQSNLFKELCKILRIAKKRTCPYHLQCDGQVERMNRTLIELLDTLRCIGPDGQLGPGVWSYLDGLSERCPIFNRFQNILSSLR